MFLVFISKEESQLNSPGIDFSFDAAICTKNKIFSSFVIF
jgi:hypothetical protein